MQLLLHVTVKQHVLYSFFTQANVIQTINVVDRSYLMLGAKSLVRLCSRAHSQ